MVAIAISVVGISKILLEAITPTASTNVPTVAAVIPSTKALIDLFCAIFLKGGAKVQIFSDIEYPIPI